MQNKFGESKQCRLVCNFETFSLSSLLGARGHHRTLKMADASHDELIVQFTSVTGADAERAKFYLESAAWSLDVTITIPQLSFLNFIPNPGGMFLWWTIIWVIEIKPKVNTRPL